MFYVYPFFSGRARVEPNALKLYKHTMIYHDLQYFCTKHLCFPALLYHFWQVSRGVKVHRTTAALGLGVQRWWTKAAAQSNSRWSRWNLWLSHVGYTVMLDWICFKEHVYVFNWYLGIHVRACVCVRAEDDLLYMPIHTLLQPVIWYQREVSVEWHVSCSGFEFDHPATSHIGPRKCDDMANTKRSSH